ncbi:MAG: hypothetical protein EOO60_05215 [Hymenobacter sp.]|nr:MAG: hypothetical protein EOO60_05215 [Hymenobacter sp.]
MSGCARQLVHEDSSACTKRADQVGEEAGIVVVQGQRKHHQYRRCVSVTWDALPSRPYRQGLSNRSSSWA